MKRFLYLLAGLALVAVTGRFAALAIDADPNQKYEVTPAAGPYMICASAYSGTQAAELAHELVLDIRRNYNLPAYIFNRGADERKKQQEEIKRIRELSPEGRVRIQRIEDQFAVLVGGWKDWDSARKALDGFKKLKPTKPSLVDKITRQREGEKDGKKGIYTETILVNPFQSSFVVPNPTTPPEQVKKDTGPDPFLKELNSGESFSVYKCRKPWTLAVAVFQSPSVIQTQESSGFLEKLMGGDSAGERLTASAMNAHNLAEQLRKREYEAYVFHTRNSSVVCIGGYERRDDPLLLRMAQGLRFNGTDAQASSVFLANPLPMEVPH